MTTRARAPHVAVDVRLSKAAGHRTYLSNLVPRLARLTPDWRWTLLGDVASLREEAWANGGNITHIHCSSSVYGVREQIELPLRVPHDTSLFWAPHYNAPLALRAPLMVTIHDAAHLRLREYTSRPLRHLYARTMFSSAVSRASAIVCVSEFTRRELTELAGVPRAPVSVVHNGVDETWFATEHSAPSPVAPPYFVCVGSLKPHKNVRTLLRAFRELEGRVPERLVLIGKFEGLLTGDADARAEVEALGSRVTLAGEVADTTLRALVRGATALVMPSLYEGFGLPPLEAMAAGCPAIVSRSASLPEVCGDAALYFDGRDAAQLVQAMLSVAGNTDQRTTRIEQGRTQARRFSWDASAQSTLEVLRGAMRR